MFALYLVKFLALVIFFIYGACNIAAAGENSSKENWLGFGYNVMLALAFIGGMLWIIGLI